MFNQTLNNIEHIYKDVGGYDMSYDENEQLCRRSWEEDYIYFCIVRSKKKGEGKYWFCNERKNTYVEGTPETRAF